MDNAPRPGIDPKLVKELIDAAEDAADAMCDSLNLACGVGHDELEDVTILRAARDRLDAAVERLKQPGSS